MDENMRVDSNEKLPIGPDSPERVQLDELVSMLNALVKGASSGQAGSAEDALTDILAASFIPRELKFEIRSHYLELRERPGFRLSDLVIEGDFLDRLFALCAKLEARVGNEEKLRRLVGYSRGLIEARLRADADPSVPTLAGDVEALVKSGPFRHLEGYLKHLWGSGSPQVLDRSEVREGFNAYWREAEIEEESIAANKVRIWMPEEVHARTEVADYWSAQANRPKEAVKPKGLSKDVLALLSAKPAPVVLPPEEPAPADPSSEKVIVDLGFLSVQPVVEAQKVEPQKVEPKIEEARKIVETLPDERDAEGRGKIAAVVEPSRKKTVEERILATPVQAMSVAERGSGEASRKKTLEEKVLVAPPRLKPVVEKVSMEPNRKKPVEEKFKPRSREEGTIKEKIIFMFEYDKPLEELDPRHLKKGDVLYCETASGSAYEFVVGDRSNDFLELKGVNGGFAGMLLYLGKQPGGEEGEWAVGLNRPIHFSDQSQTSEIRKLEVRKKATLSKATRKAGVQTSVREENEPQGPESAVAAIGDSNGSFTAYLSNLKLFEVIDENGHWMAKNRKVVIHGDILADRQAEGFRILDHIRALRIEAKKAGGEVVVLAGNHEDFMFSFLMGKKVAQPNREEGEDAGVDPLAQCVEGQATPGGPQGAGLLELSQFSGDKKMIDNFADALGVIEERFYGVLPEMWKDSRGMRLLREMCQMKLCEQIENTIFIHTDPTDGIVELILELGVEAINEHFQVSLVNGLLKGLPFDPRYHFLFDTFLYTNNRTFSAYTDALKKTGKRQSFSAYMDRLEKSGEGQWGLSRELVRRLKKEKGVEQVVFGHSDLGKDNRIHLYEGVTFTNVDQGAGKRKGKAITTASGAFVDPKGKAKAITGTAVMKRNEVKKDEDDNK